MCSFFCTRPFDQELWSSLIYFFDLHKTIRPRIMALIDLFLSFPINHSTKIYGLHSFISFIYTRPFDQYIWSSFIYSFFWKRPFDQNIWSSFIYYFFSRRLFDQKLGSSFIYFFYLRTTIRSKFMTYFYLFFLSRTTIRPKIRVLIDLFFLICTQPFD